VQADEAGAEYFETDGPEMSERLLQLSFDPAKPIQNCERIGQSLQTVRRLSMRDDGLLREWANRCSPIRDGGTRMTFH
jgi:hypothetical protein